MVTTKEIQVDESVQRSLFDKEEAMTREIIMMQVEELIARSDIGNSHDRIMRSACGLLEITHRRELDDRMMRESLALGVRCLVSAEDVTRVRIPMCEIEEREVLHRRIINVGTITSSQDLLRRAIEFEYFFDQQCTIRQFHEDCAIRWYIELEFVAVSLSLYLHRTEEIYEMYRLYVDIHLQVLLQMHILKESTFRQHFFTTEVIERTETIRRCTREGVFIGDSIKFQVFHLEMRFRLSRERMEQKVRKSIQAEFVFAFAFLSSLLNLEIEALEEYEPIAREAVDDTGHMKLMDLYRHHCEEREYVSFPHRRKDRAPDFQLRRAPFNQLLCACEGLESQLRQSLYLEEITNRENNAYVEESLMMRQCLFLLETQCRSATLQHQILERSAIVQQSDKAKTLLSIYRREGRARAETIQAERIIRLEMMKKIAATLKPSPSPQKKNLRPINTTFVSHESPGRSPQRRSPRATSPRASIFVKLPDAHRAKDNRRASFGRRMSRAPGNLLPSIQHQCSSAPALHSIQDEPDAARAFRQQWTKYRRDATQKRMPFHM